MRAAMRNMKESYIKGSNDHHDAMVEASKAENQTVEQAKSTETGVLAVAFHDTRQRMTEAA